MGQITQDAQLSQDLAVGQIPRSTERISSLESKQLHYVHRCIKWYKTVKRDRLQAAEYMAFLNKEK